MKAAALLARIVRMLGLTALGLGLLIGFTPVAAQASPVSRGTAWAGDGWLRLAHLSPNTPAVDVYLYSFHQTKAIIVVHHVAYGTVSGYQKIPSGQYTVAMRAAGASPKTPPVISTTVTIRAGHAYTVAGLGPAKGLRLQVLRDRLVTPPGKALVRVIQASLTQPRVTVRAGKSLLVRHLRFGAVTAYKVVKAGTWEVSANGRTENTRSAITLAAGSVHTIVVLDDPGSLVLDPLLDAAGSRVAPAVAPATGFGGTAPPPPGQELPWIAVVCCGLLLTLAGGVMARRPGRPGRPAPGSVIGTAGFRR
jgi:Domain of unknown function (DUF4397)